MRRVSKSWMAAVAAILLVGTLVGVVWARPHDRPQGADITRKVTLTGADFNPAFYAHLWDNNGESVECQAAGCSFTAPVVFPCLPSVTVERIKLHVADNHATAHASATLHRTYPPTGVDVSLEYAKSPSGTSGGVRTYTSPNINQIVWPSQRAYISLWISGTNIQVHGVTVEYHRNI